MQTIILMSYSYKYLNYQWHRHQNKLLGTEGQHSQSHVKLLQLAHIYHSLEPLGGHQNHPLKCNWHECHRWYVNNCIGNYT